MKRITQSRWNPRRGGFSLVELVFVVLVIGIIAAIAAPKVFHTSKSATDSSIKTSLRTIRNAIDTYAANNSGTVPGADGTQTTFYANLMPYLRSPAFPSSPVGAKNNQVRMQTSGQGLTADASPTAGWAFDNITGQFICNSNAISADGVTPYQNF